MKVKVLLSLTTMCISANFHRPTSLRPVQFLIGVFAAVLLYEIMCYGPSVEAVFLVSRFCGSFLLRSVFVFRCACVCGWLRHYVIVAVVVVLMF